MSAITQPRSAGFALAPKTMGEAMEMANMLSGSQMVLKSYQGKPQDILVATMTGSELGLNPIQGLQNIAAMKGKRTAATLQGAADDEVARAKIEATEMAERIRANLKTLADAGYDFLFADRRQLVEKDPDDLAAVVKDASPTTRQPKPSARSASGNGSDITQQYRQSPRPTPRSKP